MRSGTSNAKSKRRQPFCSVSSCNSTEPRSYHRFPKDAQTQELWIRACSSKKKISLSTARICQYHFLQDDYARDLRNELMGLPIRMKLKDYAVPTQNLNISHVWTEHDYCKSRFSAPKDVPNIEMASSSTLENQPQSQIDIKLFQKIKDDCNIKLDRNGLDPITQLSRKLRFQEDKYKKLNYEYKQLKRISSNVKRELKRQKEKVMSKSASIEQVKFYLKDFLPRSQINFIFKKSSQPGHWEENEILHSFLLYRISPMAYNYLNKNRLMALPGCSTLRKWIKNFECHLGVQSSAILKLSVTLGDNVHKPNFNLCSLNFDTYKFDEKRDAKMRPFNQIQVAMISSLTHDWSIPIFLDFECPITKLLIMRIIHIVEGKGAIVTSVTCRPGRSYHRLLCELGLSSEKPYFTFSKDISRKIFVFADPQYSIQTFGNYLLDTGFQFPDKSFLTKEFFAPFLQNIELNTSSMVYDSNESALNNDDHCDDNNDLEEEEHEVEATPKSQFAGIQLFSHEVSDLILRQNPDETKKVKFVELLANWLHVFNSTTLSDPIKYKSAFGLVEKDQIQILHSVIKKISGIRQPGTKHLLHCQLNIIITSHAMVQLYEHLKSQFGLEYILTAQLSLRGIENIFSKFKDFDSSGLSPLSILKHIRLTIMGEDLVEESEEVAEENAEDLKADVKESVVSASEIEQSVDSILTST